MKKSSYSQPSRFVAVTCLIFGFEDDELELLLSHYGIEPSTGQWSLLNDRVNENKTVEEYAARVLLQTT